MSRLVLPDECPDWWVRPRFIVDFADNRARLADADPRVFDDGLLETTLAEGSPDRILVEERRTLQLTVDGPQRTYAVRHTLTPLD